MPREYIENDTRQGGDNSNHVEVQWARDKFAQIGSIRKGDVGNTDTPARMSEGFYVNLDRSRINQLIRLLRKARDQAFGPDA